LSEWEKSVFLPPKILVQINLVKSIMANHYETVFIMTPVLSDEQMKETVQKFEKILTDQGAEIINRENWGLRKLEYPIQKKSSGFYYLMEFTAAPNVVAELELQYRRDERVIRFLTVTMDKYAVAYAEKRRNNRKAKEEAVAEEPVQEQQPVAEETVNQESNPVEA
jgi:small subunit ribosomal protein S6